ncbi:hypothetical protein CG51_01700 [Haematobacter missouriensis]|uniref:Amino acid-binding ACT domain-containing protein n=1 Tax=Haematobacter missouriensis TaxID=366616 RepID=A0A212ALA2_9RHOB|nr:hypothetical protein [Haematobacter missouriensis]KFI32436.1 hypothetical protein CG51_01700 [Haematobacter missouriensis]OWJ76494.1 amino acid-binding ACT domain-containing protein [Haematobacter missouriensis]OWJ82235.1 amino acid-binding ACT domain-containing protein [Haematobacter missouriensis]
MFDVAFDLNAHSLADLGEAMGRAGIAFEGGGMFNHGRGVAAHFLFADGEAARAAAEAAGIPVTGVARPLVRRLKQGEPGQLGAIARAVAEAGVTITAQYSDHHNRLILLVDDPEAGHVATLAWQV